MLQPKRSQESLSNSQHRAIHSPHAKFSRTFLRIARIHVRIRACEFRLKMEVSTTIHGCSKPFLHIPSQNAYFAGFFFSQSVDILRFFCTVQSILKFQNFRSMVGTYSDELRLENNHVIEENWRGCLLQNWLGHMCLIYSKLRRLSRKQ